MSINVLPIGMEHLLTGAVESARLEFKASWDPKTTGHQVLKTLCAFANDLQNQNGGYLVLGVAEAAGVVQRPVKGLTEAEIEAAQKQLRQLCTQRIVPAYLPVFYPVEFEGRRLLVLYAPASDLRPHLAPDGPKGEPRYWIRVNCETIEAQGALLTALQQQQAKVPFDDRRAHGASNTDLRSSLVREFLADVGSDLGHEPDAERQYERMGLVTRVNGHTVPRNVGLLMFTDDPRRWFRGARIEVVSFSDDGGNVLSEQVFTGSLVQQLRTCLGWLEGQTVRHVEKQRHTSEARGWVSFPVPALREALANALYHRGYEEPAIAEPVKVYLYPDRMEIISYPGPVQGIEAAHLTGSRPLPPVPARNRRIGEFLKELRLAEARGTGLPKIRRTMSENGSGAPAFDFDEGRTYFRVTLPAHPEHRALDLLRTYTYHKATGALSLAQDFLAQAWRQGTRSPAIAVTLMRDHLEARELDKARALAAELASLDAGRYARAVTVFAEALTEDGELVEARQVLDRLPSLLAAQDAFEAAIAERRLGRQDRAHQLFERAGALVLEDPRALHEFAQTKLHLTGPLSRSKVPADQEVRRRLLTEAAIWLERVTQMDAPSTRKAWAWYDLGRTRRWLGHPASEVSEAFERADALDQGDPRLHQKLAEVRRTRP